MRIKLISPRMSLRPMDSTLKRLMSPPLSLVTLASLTPESHKVIIEDENLKEIYYNDKPDLVGINVNVDTSKRAFEISKKYREQGIKVVFGGIHASVNPHHMLEHCDSVIIGDAEEMWGRLITDFQNNKLKPLYQNCVPPDLAKIPIPKWNMINKSEYLYHNIVVTSRGCPFKCDFCYNSSFHIKNPYRNRPIENVINEIKSLDTKQIMFIDDNFIGNISWTKKFIEKTKPLKLIWHAAVSTNLIQHKELINDFANSGCRSLFIGFESINHESIKSVNKKQNRIEEYEELIEILHDYGIMVNASLVFGFDHDRPDIFQNTLNWLIKNKVETMTAHILTPYPGTRLFEKLKTEGRIFEYDTRKYNTANVVFYPKNMTGAELKNGYLWIYRQFYSFKNIIKRRPKNKSIQRPYFLFNFGYRKYGRITSCIGKLGFMHKIGELGRKLAYGID